MPDKRTLEIGRRLKAARVLAGLTQQQLAEQLGLDHRQSLTSIEAGERRLSAEELLRAVDVLNLDLDYFTDAFRLVGEGEFSFRADTQVGEDVLNGFEEHAGRWIAAYRELGAREGESTQWLKPKLDLTSRSSFEHAQAAAEYLSSLWELAVPPAERLCSAIEKNLNILVLYVDAPAGISGAASQVPGLGTILVNRREPEGRRNFDLAHELFHLLTWDAMPPARVEAASDGPRPGKRNRMEQLADNFAAALLMPEAVLRARWAAREDSVELHEWLRLTATDLRVTGVACKWRAHNLGLIPKDILPELSDNRLANGRPPGSGRQVPLFSGKFVERIARGIEIGRLSVKRAASLLDLSLGELAALLRGHDFEPPFEA